jgi:hypothetical protein
MAARRRPHRGRPRHGDGDRGGPVARSARLLFSSVSDFLQGLESAINDFVLLGVAIYFLATAETRMKRKRALAALHVLRSMAHIIDMHQLTKDPEQFAKDRSLTPSSPKRN